MLGRNFAIDPHTGDNNQRDVSIFEVRGADEVFLKAWWTT